MIVLVPGPEVFIIYLYKKKDCESKTKRDADYL